jgi:hypothetical protein
MRRTALLVLCSLAPGGALAGCFGSSTPSPSLDAGLEEPVDASFPGADARPGEAALPDAKSDVEAEADGPGLSDAPPVVDGPEVTDAPLLDGPVDAAPVGMFPTALVDFGLVPCGSAPTQMPTYSFTNTGLVPVTYSADVGTATLFSIDGASSGTVAPGATGSITLAAAVVPATSSAGAPIAGTLTLTTDVPGFSTVAVPLQITPQGGSLALSPATAVFGDVELSVQAPDIALTLSNVGNAPVGVTVGTPTDPEFAVVYTGAPAASTVAPGSTLAGAAARFNPASVGAKSATAAIQTTGVLCASPATSIAMTGSGTTEPVTVSPGMLSFGAVDCGTQSTLVLPVTITNGYAFAVDFTASLASGTASPYILDVSTGTVPAGGQAVIHVTPRPVPATATVAAGFFDDILTVDTSAPGSTPTSIGVQETVQGAILGLAMASTAFGNVVAVQSGALPFTVTNTGNLAAPLTLEPSGAGFGAAFTGSSTAAAGGGTAPGNATFVPQGPGAVTGSLGVSTTTALCAPLPPALSLSATGVGPAATYATAALALAVTCGGAASGTTSLLVTNGTAFPLTLTASSQNGDFDVLTPTVSIPANSRGNITIQAPAVATGSKAQGTYADNLLFTTNEYGSPTHAVPVNVTLTGANLSFAGPASFTFDSCPASSAYTIENTGNVTVDLVAPANTLEVGFDFATQEGVTLGPGQSTTGAVRPISQATTATCSGTQSFTFTALSPVVGAGLVPAAVCLNEPMQVTWDIALPTLGGECRAGPCC